MVRTGLDRLIAEESKRISGRRIGVLCHHASITRNGTFIVDALRAAGANVVRYLGPEHGPWGTAQDMIPVDGGTDRWTGLPLVSLYGEHESSLAPAPEALDELDALVVDLQDVGARYYTYVQTAAFATDVAHAAGVETIICDRPNPINGVTVEGTPLHSSCASFVGMHPVPQRHGMTLGELVRCYTDDKATIIPMEGWDREMWFEDTGLPWVPPSPNMPTVGTAAVYPGGCLLEGTNVSEGRGTTTPFEVLGAPWVDPFLYSNAMNDLELPGVRFRPHVFQPTFQKYAGVECGGAQIMVHDRNQLRPLRLGLALLCVMRRLWPAQFQWRTEQYEYVTDRPAIDLLFGTKSIREAIDAGTQWPAIVTDWPLAEDQWLHERKRWLLYG